MPASTFLHGCEPPWEAFPQIAPDELSQHLKQGPAEAWFDQRWRPFWQSLSPGQQAEYLDFWHASAEWREAIAFHFQPEDDFDREEDARESEAWLAREKSSPGKPGLISRLFRGKR